MSIFDSIRATRDKRIDQVVGRKLTISQHTKEQDEAEGFVPRKSAFGHITIEPPNPTRFAPDGRTRKGRRS